MSVLNQVLKDLQARETPRVDRRARLALGLAANDPLGRRTDPRVWIALLLGGAAIGFVLAAFVNLAATGPAAGLPAQTAAADAAPTIASSPVAPAIAAPAERAGQPPPPLPEPAGTALAGPQTADSAADRPQPSTPGPADTEPPVEPDSAAAAFDSPPPPASGPVAAAERVGSSRIGSIRSGWEPGRTRFVFKFDRWPKAITLDSDADGAIEIGFAETRPADRLPAPPGFDRLLSGLSQRSDGDRLVIRFVPAEGLRLTAAYHRMSFERNWSQWVVLDLRAEPVVSNEPEPAATRVADPEPEPTPRSTGTESLRRLDISPSRRSPTEQALDRLDQARGALAGGRPGRAAAHARAALEADPSLESARELLAGLLIREQRLEAATELVERGLVLNPASLDLAKLGARLKVQQGQDQAALAILEPVATEGAGQADYRALRASLYQRLGRHEEAVLDFLAALETDRRPALWWLGLGVSLESIERGEDALAAYDEALGRGLPSGEVREFAEARRDSLRR